MRITSNVRGNSPHSFQCLPFALRFLPAVQRYPHPPVGSSNPRLSGTDMTPYRSINWLTSSTGSGFPRHHTVTISSSSLSLTGLNLGSFVPARWHSDDFIGNAKVGAMVPMHPRSCPCFSMNEYARSFLHHLMGSPLLDIVFVRT